MDPLTPAARRDLRAKAHHLEPVVTVGQHGLTPSVLHEIDLALLAQELVKVKVHGDDRALRESMLAQLAESLSCAPVQHVGKVLVLWRPNPEKPKRQEPVTKHTAVRKKTKKSGPPAPVDTTRARRRATQGEWGTNAPIPTTGKGRRGAARHGAPAGRPPVETKEPAAAPAPARRRRTREA